ncbi:MAG: hypothetical protein IKF79_08000, partial [Methanosphaera sp.]|nr:hypothetical protein [Methanosphaera sp.]
NGTYQLNNYLICRSGTTTPNITIQANNQILSTQPNTAYYVMYNNGCNITINDATITHRLHTYNNLELMNVVLNSTQTQVYTGATLTLKNSTLNGRISGGKIIIDDECTFGENFQLQSNEEIIISDINKIALYMSTFTGNYTLENLTLTNYKENLGNLTLKNCTINTNIYNNGILNISDDCILGENALFTGNGTIIFSDMDKLFPYLGTYNGNYTLENMNITSGKTNNGNLTLKNSIINNRITNYGNLTLINTTVNSDLWTYGTIFVGENVTVNNSNVYIRLFNDGTIIANDTSILSPYIDYIINGNYTIKDSVITRSKTNNANLTINNSTIKSQLTNNGNLTINTSNISIEGYNPQISNNGNLTITNTTINSTVINNQNINILNSMINAILENNQNATLENSTINATISNNGNLTIADDIILRENAKIEGTGNITINDTSKITPYMDSYPNGDYLIKDVVINTLKTNNGNLTITNTTLNNKMTNNKNLFIENSTINTTISNNGNLTIADDVIFTENAKIEGTGNITINDTSKVMPYLDIYPNGDYLIKDVVINTFKTNYANLTIINSTINGVIDNYGNLVLDNCTLNNIVINKGNLTIGDNVIFGENFKLYSTGEIISNNSDRINPYLEAYNLSYTEVTDYNSFMTAIRSSGNDANNEMCIINVLEGNYWFSNYNTQINNRGSVNKIIIEGNNQTFNGSNAWIRYTNMENFIINNLTLDKVSFRTEGLNSRLEINNSIINSTIVNVNGTLMIDDDTIIDSYAKFSFNNISINDIYRILPYTTEINSNISIENFTFINQITFNANTLLSNCTINNSITNYGNLTLNNSNLNKTIANYGNITILNCSVNEDTFRITNNGNVTCDDLAKYLPYITYIKGEYILNDYTINKTFTNNGQITANNCTFNSTITNNGQITANNCILNSSIMNNGVLIINDETIIDENFRLNGNGEIIINDTNKIAPYLTTYNGNYTIENITITTIKTNNGNLTIRNSTINSQITNNGNMTITNSTLNSRIRNSGNLTITDDCIIGENCQIIGNGQLIMNNTARIGIYSGNNIINNTIIDKTITIPNDGNFTANNCNITSPLTNSGNLTVNNCNITDIIGNIGNLIMNNCSFSNNNMVTYLSSGQSNSGFLLNNNANASLINCIMENNTFNASGFIGSPPSLNGAIYNKGVLNIINCSFKNNSIGYSRVDDGAVAFQGTNIGQGSVIFSNGTLSVYDSNFTDNYAGNSGGAIYSYSRSYTQNGNYYIFNDSMYINNSYFANNVAGLQGGAITFSGTGLIENSVFINNSEILNNNVIDNTGGGAIYS